jgi:hypothetical protein
MGFEREAVFALVENVHGLYALPTCIPLLFYVTYPGTGLPGNDVAIRPICFVLRRADVNSGTALPHPRRKDKSRDDSGNGDTRE